MNASLRELVLAVRYGDASLVGESVGYIILGAADRAQTVPRRADLDSILLTGEGEVALDAAVCGAEDAERSLRVLLGGLLTLVRSPCPNLERVARRQQFAGLPHLVVELEAALVPVNRKAARRALSRLVREARRSAARAEQHVAVAAVLPEEDRSWGAASGESLEEPVDATLVRQDSPELEADVPAPFEEVRDVLPVEEHWSESDAAAVATPGDSFEFPQAPPMGGRPMSAAQAVGDFSSGYPAVQAYDSPRERHGETRGDSSLASGTSSAATLSGLAENGGMEGGWGATSIFEVPLEDELDHAETHLCAPVAAVAPPRPARPIGLFLHSGRAELPVDLPLIASRPAVTSRRPSDAAELLGGARLHHGPSSELYKSLKQLSQVDFSRSGAGGAST